MFEYNDMVRQAMQARGKRGLLFHAPLLLVKPVIPVIDKALPRLITKDQFTMLLEGSTTEDRRLEELGGFPLTPFRKAIRVAFKEPPPRPMRRDKG